MFKTCEHSDCAVCLKLEEREIFKSILKNRHPDLYICPHSAYKITNSDGNYFIIPSLECVSKSNKGYFVLDFYTSMRIFLNRENFEVICSNNTECKNKEPIVILYK